CTKERLCPIFASLRILSTKVPPYNNLADGDQTDLSQLHTFVRLQVCSAQLWFESAIKFKLLSFCNTRRNASFPTLLMWFLARLRSLNDVLLRSAFASNTSASASLS
ncbi:hypothetical protein ACHAWC_009975, partial [Mediolabrus comicus]